MEKVISEYEQQALDFLKLTNTEFKAEFIENDYYFEGDKEPRDIYKITLKRGQRKYSFKFGQSISNSGFYAQYGVTKYHLSYDMINLSDYELKRYVKMNMQYDFGHVKKDKIVRPVAPNAYDVLACLEKYEHETFKDFCDNFGYDTDSISAKKVYKACKKQFDKLSALYNEQEMDLLREIN